MSGRVLLNVIIIFLIINLITVLKINHRMNEINNSLIAKEKECLIIRAPITNENISIYGDEEEIKWLHLELVKCDAYTYK